MREPIFPRPMASGDMSYAMKIAHCVGPDFALYSGNDDITLPGRLPP